MALPFRINSIHVHRQAAAFVPKSARTIQTIAIHFNSLTPSQQPMKYPIYSFESVPYQAAALPSTVMASRSPPSHQTSEYTAFVTKRYRKHPLVQRFSASPVYRALCVLEPTKSWSEKEKKKKINTQ